VGYTHYWSFNFKAGKSADLETKYQKAILECQKVVRAIAEDNRKVYGSSCLSGYTAHCTPGQYGGIKVNGKGDDSCEDFFLREHFRENGERNFCKTRQRTYDTAVVACLAVLKYRLGDAITVTSDGTSEDWEEGVNFAAKVLKRKVKVPSTIFHVLRLAR